MSSANREFKWYPFRNYHKNINRAHTPNSTNPLGNNPRTRLLPGTNYGGKYEKYNKFKQLPC